MVLDVTPSQAGIYLKINASDPADPIRNIHVVMQGFEDVYETEPFHPLFLERLGHYGSIRFMGWQRTNNSIVKDWANRTTKSTYTQAVPGGVAVEYMVELANELRVDPWFCMPHAATDDYVTQFATLVRDQLDPDLKVYLEYSNETWNHLFDQTKYCEAEGLKLGLSTSSVQAGLFYHAKRAVEIFQVWEGVFGSPDRLVRVLASQFANPWTGEQVMGFQNAAAHADVYAVAPYFGGYLGLDAHAPQTIQMTTQEVLDAAAADIAGTILPHVQDNALEASAHGLELVAYEGGQHMVGVGVWQNDPTLNALFDAANVDWQMYDLYRDLLEAWQGAGGGLFMAFSACGLPSKFGRWGLIEYQDQPLADAPKYSSLLDLAGEQKHVTLFGQACGGLGVAHANAPSLGSTDFELRLGGAPPGGSALLALGNSATSWLGVPLPMTFDAWSAPGCALYGSVSLLFAAPVDGSGVASQTLPVPDSPVLLGNPIYSQWTALDPAANPLGLTFSRGVRINVQP